MENTGIIETMNAAEATEWLRARGVRISPEALRNGIEQKVFPFGDYIHMEKSPRCLIYTQLLEDWAAARYKRPSWPSRALVAEPQSGATGV